MKTRAPLECHQPCALGRGTGLLHGAEGLSHGHDRAAEQGDRGAWTPHREMQNIAPASRLSIFKNKPWPPWETVVDSPGTWCLWANGSILQAVGVPLVERSPQGRGSCAGFSVGDVLFSWELHDSRTFLVF